MAPKVSIIIVNTNELHHLQDCLPSLIQQNYPDYEVLIVDNASTDASLAYVQQEFPQFRIIHNPSNLGYAGANNVGFQYANGELIAVLNPDTKVDPYWLDELVSVFNDHPGAGLVTPKILLYDHPELINTCGNEITLSGLTFCRGLEETKEHYLNLERISSVSGAAFLIRRNVLEKIGGFDERYFIYYEETDLCLRAMLAGYELYYVPDAVVYHKYAFRYSPKKAFYQERNRYFSLLKTLHWGTLLAMFPSLFVAEIIAWGYAIINGPQHIASKFQTYAWLMHNFSLVMQVRQQVQCLRRVKDREILKWFGYRLNFAQTTTPWLARLFDILINPFMFIFGFLTRKIVFW